MIISSALHEWGVSRTFVGASYSRRFEDLVSARARLFAIVRLTIGELLLQTEQFGDSLTDLVIDMRQSIFLNGVHVSMADLFAGSFLCFEFSDKIALDLDQIGEIVLGDDEIVGHG